MIVAIPKFNDEIAPCFEVAGTFVITAVEQESDFSMRLHKCEGCEGFSRLRFLNERRVEVLICNGIKGFYKDILNNSGIIVIDNISSSVEKALNDYRNGKLKPKSEKSEIYNIDSTIPLDDIICWTKDLFKSNGYKVYRGEELTPFPIDIIAEMKCPVCGKPVRVAICCGAHSYRVDQELQEFHRVASTDFHARVYVHSAKPEIVKRCEEYGIELIDPFADTCEIKPAVKSAIPVLKQPARGHEKAWN